MRTLVTGATGLLGNNVTRLLIERGDEVRVLVRSQADRRPLLGLPVDIADGDVRHADSVLVAAQGMDRIIHAAGRVHIGWSGLEAQRAVNVIGTRNVAAAALAADCRLVHVSTVDTLGIRSRENPADEDTPPSGLVACPYVVTKRQAELELARLQPQGLNYVIVNPGFIVGPWDWKPSSGRMLLQVGRGLGIFAPSGGNDFCDARDVANGVLLAAELGVVGRRYILAGEALSYLEAWRLFAEVTGRNRPVGIASRAMLWVSGRAGDLWGRITGSEPDVNSAATALAELPHHFSAERARQELGYTCRPARESAEAAWAWFREYGYA